MRILNSLKSEIRNLYSNLLILRSVFLWSLLIVGAASTYLVTGMSWVVSIVVLGVTLVISSLVSRFSYTRTVEASQVFFPVTWLHRLFLFLVAFIDLVIIYVLSYARIPFALQTPWFSVHWTIFAFFALASTLLLWLAATDDARSIAWVTTLHYFVTYGAALIVFQLGFGYDPLIHQTAEQYIVDHGRIYPIQPFYVGQYSIVTLIHFVTQLPVQFVDRLLLPMLAVFTLPSIAFFGLTHAYGVASRTARVSVCLLPMLAIPLLTFTAPFNLTVLYTLWWVFLFPFLSSGTVIERITVLLIALAALVTHPLLGFPLLLASVLPLLLRKYFFVTTVTATVFSILGMLGLYRWIQGFPPFETTNLGERAIRFLNFFFPNFFHSWVSWPFLLLYSVATLVPVATVVVGLIHCIRDRRFRVLVGMTLGIFMSMFMVTLFIQLPGVIDYEQAEFALRLRAVLPIFVLPLFLIGCASLVFRAYKSPRLIALCCTIGGMFLAGSWYMTYPRIDAAENRAGWNVAQHDIDAVRRIEDDAHGEPYIVLADRLLAAVALRELGFQRTIESRMGERPYAYSLWPGDRTFPIAQRVLYGRFATDDLATLREDFPHTRIYVAVHEYWYRVETIDHLLLNLGARHVASPYGVRVYAFDK